MSFSTIETLNSLRPLTKTNVIDLLKEVGHDVTPWAFTNDGTAVATPAANPNYCYDWAFGSEQEGIALCVWHKTLVLVGERIEFQENLRALGDRLSSFAANTDRNPKDRSRARQQAVRAYHFDSLVRMAFNRMLPIRFIINDGKLTNREQLGERSSSVLTRKLDDKNWYVHAYDERSGNTTVVREQRPTLDSAGSETSDDEDRGPSDKRQLAAISVRRGQPEFREKLLSAWERKCVVTGCRVVGLLEAAHITPHAEGTDYRTSNGLLLRADIHTLYDLGLLSIDQHMRVHLAEELMFSEYRQYSARQIERQPARSADAPSREALSKRHAVFLEKAKTPT